MLTQKYKKGDRVILISEFSSNSVCHWNPDMIELVGVPVTIVNPTFPNDNKIVSIKTDNSLSGYSNNAIWSYPISHIRPVITNKATIKIKLNFNKYLNNN